MNRTIPLEITRIDENLPLPKYETSGAVAFDLYSRTTENIVPGETILINSNLIVTVPEGYALIIAARSSLFRKKGLIFPNGIGVIDQDYCGVNDEIKIPLSNPGSDVAVVVQGERIAQALLIPIAKAEIKELPLSVRGSSRGGFGSTGS